MRKAILYREKNGKPAVAWPTEKYQGDDLIHHVAQRAVPAGNPYKIVNESEIPDADIPHDAWIFDDSILTDGIGTREN